MISDPMTAPNDWRGRLVHAAAVGALAYVCGFDFYRTNGFLWALFAAAPLVPLWDWLWPMPKFEWASQGARAGMKAFNVRRLSTVTAVLLSCLSAIATTRTTALAFCGFYVGKVDTGLYNHASQVVYVRHDDKNVISIMNDYQGEPAEFALVVPVPVVLQKGQIHIGDRELFKRLDAYSSPRLVEYYDFDPCARQVLYMNAPASNALGGMAMEKEVHARPKALGVTIEAQYTVGEYDILILSATQSDGLETWLQQSGYHIPLCASRALQPYIRQKLKFFVAKVNLKEHQRRGLSYLRPIQFAFESAKFMLPIRLGMINSQGPQDLVIYMLTKDGRVETTNYRPVKLPTRMDLPEYIQKDFGAFYKAMFDRQVAEKETKVVFTEYAWNLGWCDPCAAPPLTQDELRQLGVFWLDNESGNGPAHAPLGGGIPFEQVPVVLTRLHVRYSSATFPEDLSFQETEDRENFQARYVLRHAWAGSPDSCPAATNYFDDLRQRRETEAVALADLTGWDISDIHKRTGLNNANMPKSGSWWQQLWR